ncbi:chaperone protein DNAj, putative [Leishmania guyanensis]
MLPPVVAPPFLTAVPPKKATSCALSLDEQDPNGMDGLTGVQFKYALEAYQLFGVRDYPADLAAFLRVFSVCLAHKLTLALLNRVAVCHFVMKQWNACEACTQRALSVHATGRYPSSRRRLRVFISQERLRGPQQAISTDRDAIDGADEVAAVKAYANYTNFYAAHPYGTALKRLEVVL